MSTLRERPILFSAPMVHAVLAGSKTQTRRVNARTNPYGRTGDRLWVRETWQHATSKDSKTAVAYRADGSGRVAFYEDDGNGDFHHVEHETPLLMLPLIWRPSIFMPRGASRITLELTDVRVQPLQNITEEDARAEGCSGRDPEPRNVGGLIYAMKGRSSAPDARAHFAVLWDSINSKRPGCAWADNPWVWALTFRRVDP